MAENKADNGVLKMFPYLIVRGAAGAIEFYKRAFGAEEGMRLCEPGGRIGHAELKMGAGMVMLAEEAPERGVMSPLALGGTGSMLHLHVGNVDEMTRRAAEAGATVLAPPTTHFYGERSSKVQDPYGHVWMLGQHIEEVSPEEMQRRYTDLLSKKT
jgi:PhnB protein